MKGKETWEEGESSTRPHKRTTRSPECSDETEELPELDWTTLLGSSSPEVSSRAPADQSSGSVMVESETQLLLQPEPRPEPGEGEMETLLQSEQLQQEMTWMQDFTSSLDDQIRRDDPEQVVSEYLREPTPEQREDEAGPAEEPLPALIEDTDEEEPLTPEGYGYPVHEEENSPEQVPAPPVGGELEADEPDEEADEPDEGDEPDEEGEPEEGNEPDGEEDQDEEEEPEVAEEQNEEIEEEEEIEIEIEVNVEIEIEVEEEEEPVEDELEENENEDEWPLGDFEEGGEGELIGPDGEEEEQPDDDGWEVDDDEDSEASTVTDA